MPRNEKEGAGQAPSFLFASNLLILVLKAVFGGEA